MKVWVVLRDYGGEGLSEPIRVFADENLKNVYVSGVEAGWGTAKVFESEVEGYIGDYPGKIYRVS